MTFIKDTWEFGTFRNYSPGSSYSYFIDIHVSTWTGDCDLDDVCDWFSAEGEEDGGGDGDEMTYGENLCWA